MTCNKISFVIKPPSTIPMLDLQRLLYRFMILNDRKAVFGVDINRLIYFLFKLCWILKFWVLKKNSSLLQLH